MQSHYDADNRLVFRSLAGVLDPIHAEWTHDSAGLPQTLTRVDDSTGQPVAITSYGYDGDSRLTSLVHRNAAGSALAQYSFTYDPGSRLSSETINGQSTSYSYDGSNQLTGAGANAYSYDANGNRTGSGYQTGPDNELQSDGTWTYSYDNEGNRVGKTNIANGQYWTYGYDDANELTAAKQYDSQGHLLASVTYVYDVLGHRIEQDTWTAASGTTAVLRTVYDGDQPYADLNSSGAIATRYLNGAAVDEVLAREGAEGAVAWYLADNLGSVRGLIDNTGAVRDHITYDAFGTITAETNPSYGDRLKFTGAEYDPTTGLYHMSARYYDPSTGQWLSQDPEGFDAGDSNLYRYVGNGPTYNVDPTGLDTVAVQGESVVWQRPTNRSVLRQVWDGLTGQNQTPERHIVIGHISQ